MERSQAELFKSLGVESRLRIIELLKRNGPLCVNDMAAQLGITSSAVSQHLKVLRNAGLVRNERKGYWIPYEIDPAAMERCKDLLFEVCDCGCEGSAGFGPAELERAPNKLVLLEKYEKGLLRELKKVRDRIRSVKEKKPR